MSHELEGEPEKEDDEPACQPGPSDVGHNNQAGPEQDIPPIIHLLDILRNREQETIETVVNQEIIGLSEAALVLSDFPSLKDVSEAEYLIGLFIYLLDQNLVASRQNARLAVLNIGTRMDTIPASLFLSKEQVKIENTFPGDYGNFFNIYLGEYKGTRVTFKRIRVHQMDKDFCREALAWRTLSHRNILPFIGIYADYAQSFVGLASVYMNDGTLSEWRKRSAPTLPEIHMQILEVAEGLQYLHSEGVVHGDLRAGHVLLGHDGVKICNFSLTLNSDSTAIADPVLSAQFTAPELFADDICEDVIKPNAKTDVYAFAFLCYELYFGVYPFGKTNLYTIGLKVQKGIRPARLPDPVLKDMTWEVIERCWSQDPLIRPDMVEVLELMGTTTYA